MKLRALVLCLALCAGTWSAGEDDIVDLPGLQFVVNFKTYSGYLNANDKGNWQMHYMLTESRSDPSSDPLIVWFNGGPGCSSYVGLFEELGPFYVNYDGQSLYENIYSWNTRANVLYLESPIGVGFSYDTTQDSYSVANDDQTADQNYAALKDFFTRVQPRYKNRTFFLAGESYAGVYVPMLSMRIVKGINAGDFPNHNFQSYMQQKVSSSFHRNLNRLKVALQREWQEIDVNYLRPTVEAIMKRLEACILAKGDHFEQ